MCRSRLWPLVLRQHDDSPEARVDEIRESEVDQPVVTAERNCRLRPVGRQRRESLALTAGRTTEKTRDGPPANPKESPWRENAGQPGEQPRALVLWIHLGLAGGTVSRLLRRPGRGEGNATRAADGRQAKRQFRSA